MQSITARGTKWLRLEHQEKFLIMKTQQSKPGIVKAMRQIRDKFSNEIMEMTLAEEKAYIKEQIAKIKLKRERNATAV